MWKFLLGLALSVCFCAPAFAACTKPSGTYVGAGGGAVYQGGAYVTSIAIAYTLTIASNGSGSVSQVGKRIDGTSVSVSLTFPSSNNLFNQSTCRGILTMSNGSVNIYTSSGSGNEVMVVYYGNDDLYGDYVLVAKKV
jgi:hypothetical protein